MGCFVQNNNNNIATGAPYAVLFEGGAGYSELLDAVVSIDGDVNKLHDATSFSRCQQVSTPTAVANRGGFFTVVFIDCASMLYAYGMEQSICVTSHAGLTP